MAIEQLTEVIAGGGSNDDLEARHVLSRGTNRKIGRAIGRIEVFSYPGDNEDGTDRRS